MRKKLVVASLSALMLSAASLAVAECEKGFEEVIASGSVNTTNLEGGMQTGQIALTLTSTKTGKVVFDKQGGVMGQITGVDASGYPIKVTLNHIIRFAPDFELDTYGDVASVYGNPFACNVPVEEVISTYTGTKIFKQATGSIVAEGFLNLPNESGYCINNQFELSGTLCVAK